MIPEMNLAVSATPAAVKLTVPDQCRLLQNVRANTIAVAGMAEAFVAIVLPGRDFSDQRRLVANAAIETSGRENGEFGSPGPAAVEPIDFCAPDDIRFRQPADRLTTAVGVIEWSRYRTSGGSKRVDKRRSSLPKA